MRKLAILALGLVAGACGGGGGGGDDATKAGSDAAAVAIDTFQFSPKDLTVPAGDSVTWTNNDAIHHTATGDGFDLQLQAKGTSASFTFEKPGTYAYTCTRHPGMAGTVIVR